MGDALEDRVEPDPVAPRGGRGTTDERRAVLGETLEGVQHVAPTGRGGMVHFVHGHGGPAAGQDPGETRGGLDEGGDRGKTDPLVAAQRLGALLNADQDARVGADHGAVKLIKQFTPVGEDEQGEAELPGEHGEDEGFPASRGQDEQSTAAPGDDLIADLGDGVSLERVRAERLWAGTETDGQAVCDREGMGKSRGSR
jgi:hypothetical protein